VMASRSADHTGRHSMRAKPTTVRFPRLKPMPEDEIIRMALDVLIRECNGGKTRPDGCNRHAGQPYSRIVSGARRLLKRKYAAA
jgi:hypothetical protein